MIKTRTIHCFGKNDIREVIWDRPEMSDDQIECKILFCGQCRSDIGNFMAAERMPYSDGNNPDGKIGTWGHEGLSIVTRKGRNIKNVPIGAFVATWSDPAYADYYYAKENEFVIVPEASPKYILQPVASAVNIAEKTMDMLRNISQDGSEISPRTPILLLGSGFMSFVVFQILKKYQYELVVCGSSHKSIWKDKFGIELQNVDAQEENSFGCVIDLTSKSENFDKIIKICKNEGLICYASTPYSPVTTNFFETCWKCHTWIFPSPRNSDFNEIMAKTRDYIMEGFLDTEWMWSKGYDRENMDEVRQGFIDGVERKGDYIRGYIKW